MIKNSTRNRILAKNAKICRNILSKLSGLMFSKKRALIFVFGKEKIIPLHMIFVFFPIDVLFLDKNKKVAEIKENFKPFSLYTPKNKAMYILELPLNIIKNSGTKVGDKIGF